MWAVYPVDTRSPFNSKVNWSNALKVSCSRKQQQHQSVLLHTSTHISWGVCSIRVIYQSMLLTLHNTHCYISFQQVWSLLFPSWTSFILLMWSCIVWVTPRFNAKDSAYYTTPLLVIYAIVWYSYNTSTTWTLLRVNWRAMSTLVWPGTVVPQMDPCVDNCYKCTIWWRSGVMFTWLNVTCIRNTAQH